MGDSHQAKTVPLEQPISFSQATDFALRNVSPGMLENRKYLYLAAAFDVMKRDHERASLELAIEASSTTLLFMEDPRTIVASSQWDLIETRAFEADCWNNHDRCPVFRGSSPSCTICVSPVHDRLIPEKLRMPRIQSLAALLVGVSRKGMRPISLFNVYLRLLGINGQFARPIRVLALLLNSLAVLYSLTYIFVNFKCVGQAFRLSHFVCDAVHVTVLYIWSWENIVSIRPEDDPEVLSRSNLLCLVQAAFSSGICHASIAYINAGVLFREDASTAWRLFVVFSETVGTGFNRLQAFAVYFGIAASLSLSARGIDNMVTRLDPHEADLAGREVMILCSSLERKFSAILKLVYFEFSIRLMTQIPMVISEFSCRLESYDILNALDRLLALLLVISAGERVYQSAFKLRKRVRKILTARQLELLPFLRVAHGVLITSSTVMNWKSFSAFLGLISGFSFMVFQLTVADSHPCAEIGSRYC